MSSPLDQYIIRTILTSLYGDTSKLRYLMHSTNRLAQFIIADALLERYRQIITNPNNPIDPEGYRLSLNQAVQTNIQEELATFPDHVVNDKRRELYMRGPNPYNFPRFLKSLLPLDE